jgi:hypothetical protein
LLGRNQSTQGFSSHPDDTGLSGAEQKGSSFTPNKGLQAASLTDDGQHNKMARVQMN